MLTDEQLIEELRTAMHEETSELHPPAYLTAAVHDELARPASRRWPRPGLSVILPMATAAAVAIATLILLGSGHGQPRHVQPGSGPVRTGVAKRVKDPEGGPDWALGLVPGAHGEQCIVVGRVPPNSAEIPARPWLDEQCGATDAHGFAFINTFARQLSAASTSRACPMGFKPCRVQTLNKLRNVAYGLLGPDAVSVSYPGPGGKTITERTGPDGAYLVVGPATDRSCVINTRGRQRCFYGAAVVGSHYLTSGEMITRVVYRDGTSCSVPVVYAYDPAVRRFGCQPIGYTAPPPASHGTAPRSARPRH